MLISAIWKTLLDQSSKQKPPTFVSGLIHSVRRGYYCGMHSHPAVEIVFMSEHFAGISSLRDVAEHVGVSHDHLRHLFIKARGRSLIRHLNEIKVARAKILLTNSPLPLKQIAATCGFKDEYYFSAVFRRLTNLSPGLYRNKGLSLAPGKSMRNHQ